MNRLKDLQKQFFAALTVHSLSWVDIWWPRWTAVSDTVSHTPITVTPLVEILHFLPLNKSKQLFDPLNLLLNSLAYFSHTSIRIFNPDRVGASRLRSWAKASVPTERMPQLQPTPVSSSLMNNPSMYTANRSGDKTPPWLTPLTTPNWLDISSAHLTRNLWFVYMYINNLITSGDICLLIVLWTICNTWLDQKP